jgi:hypothetical protein
VNFRGNFCQGIELRHDVFWLHVRHEDLGISESPAVSSGSLVDATSWFGRHIAM